MFSLTVKIHPGKVRVNEAYKPRIGKKSKKPYTQKAAGYRSGQAIIGEAAMLHRMETGLTTLEGPVSVVLRFFWKDSHKSGPAEELATGDVDGPVKGVLDSLEAGKVFHDDAQVQSLTVSKHVDPENPRIEIQVSSSSTA